MRYNNLSNRFFTLLLVAVLAGSTTVSSNDKDAWPLGLEPEFQLPKDAPLTKEAVALGRKLFFDKNLSLDRTVSCGTCHDPKHGFSNGQTFGIGVHGQKGKRNVPTIINRVFGTTQFWDGRAKTLEDQALGPLFAPDEMGMNEDLVMTRIKEDDGYIPLFKAAYNAPPNTKHLAKAIAAFERTVVSGGSPFDKYEWNGDTSALDESAIRGLQLFRGKAQCSTCHTGTNFSDEKFHNLGVGLEKKKETGRMAVTGKTVDYGAYKTPTLRNIDSTAPYMHDGSLKSLAEVIDFYDKGGEANENLDAEIKPLNLTQTEKTDLINFLKSLSAPVRTISPNEINDLMPIVVED